MSGDPLISGHTALHWDNLPASFKEIQAKRSCQAGPRKHVGKSKSKREDLAGVTTWRTDRCVVEATQARESDHQSCSLCAIRNSG